MNNLIIRKDYVLLIISILFIATAKAQIVYTDINPDTTITTGTIDAVKTYGLDLNKDGTVDFNIQSVRGHDWAHGTLILYVKVTPLNTNEILDSLSGSVYYPGALILNSYVGNNSVWRHTSSQIMKYASPTNSGPWTFNTDAYLGLKLIIASDTSYGWVRLSIQKTSTTISFTIKDYSFNSIPNQPILAGEISCVTPTVTLSTSGTLSFCAGDSVTFTANGTGYLYQWKKNNVNISGATSKNYTAKTAGIYKCKVTNSCGSKTSGTRTVTVPCRMNNENFVESLEHLSVFPNPAINTLNIKIPSDEGEILITNLFGQIIYSKKVNEGQMQVDASKFQAGMYVVRWTNAENSETKKFSVIK